MADDADGGAHHEHEGRGGHGDERREAEQEDHHRNVHDAAADAQNGADEAHEEGAADAEPDLASGELVRIELVGRAVGGLVAGAPVHEAAEEGERRAEGDREGGAREPFAHVAPEEGARHRGECKGHRHAKDDALLPEVGPGARDLLNVREGAARRLHHEVHEERHHDEAAADADESAEGADADAENEELDEVKHDRVVVLY